MANQPNAANLKISVLDKEGIVISFPLEPEINIYDAPKVSEFSICAGGCLIKVTCYDINGTIILVTHKSQLDVSAFPAGIYLLRIQTENGMYLRRFVKKDRFGR